MNKAGGIVVAIVCMLFSGACAGMVTRRLDGGLFSNITVGAIAFLYLLLATLLWLVLVER